MRKYDISTNQIQGWPAGPDITSDTGILMDADTGVVLYNKGGDEQRYPASITKIMTLLVAVENSTMDEKVTFTETGVRNVTADSSNIGTKVGEVLTMEDCLHALIIQSANDVAAQIAEHIGGTEQAFIDMMNQRASEIGCTNTHFANSSGLPDDNHYSSARDMALIFREGLKNETFRTVVGTPDYIIQPTNMNSQQRILHTHHPMFAPESGFYYEGCIGGKTGTTVAAGHTLVTGVTRDNTTYIAVTMRGTELSNSCMDSTAMFNYAFENFTKTEVNGGYVFLPKGVELNSLTEKSENTNGKTETGYYFGDYLIGTASVAQATDTPVPEPTAAAEDSQEADSSEAEDSTEAAEEDNSKTTEKSTAGEDTSEKKSIPALRKILLMIMAAMILVLIALLAALRNKRKETSQIIENEKEKVKNGKIKVTQCGDIEGLKVIEPTVFGDSRGYFMETYNYNDFKEAGIDVEFVQDNQSSSRYGVLRGLHFQISYPQDKLVRVVNGEVFDVAVDLREGSKTFGKWYGVVLSAENKKQFFIPKGFAHGFLVLSENAEFTYKCSDFYHPNDEGGLIWNDKDINVEWPIPEGMELIFSDKDQKWGSFEEYKNR